jgi:SM-20-related protein
MSSQAGAPGRMPPFHIYREFLAPADHEYLIDCAISRETDFVPSKLYGGIHNAERRSSLSLPTSVDKSWRNPLMARIDELAPSLFADVGVPPFDLCLKELELVAYNDGAHFKPHIDLMTGEGRHERGDRALSGVYYFHREPKRFSGGELRIYAFGPQAAAAFVDVPPEQNSFVLFPSWARHEVREVSCPSGQFADSRFSVNCWLNRPRTAAN